MQGQNQLENEKLDLWKVELDTKYVLMKILDFKLQSRALQHQLKAMRSGGSLSFWPKIALHPQKQSKLYSKGLSKDNSIKLYSKATNMIHGMNQGNVLDAYQRI